MIFLIISIIFALLAFILYKKNVKTERMLSDIISLIGFSILFFIIFIIHIFFVKFSIIDFQHRKIEIQSMQNEIKKMGKDNKSLENLEHYSYFNLISLELPREIIKYNSDITYYQTCRKNIFCKIFWNGLFINDDIFEQEILK